MHNRSKQNGAELKRVLDENTRLTGRFKRLLINRAAWGRGAVLDLDAVYFFITARARVKFSKRFIFF